MCSPPATRRSTTTISCWSRSTVPPHGHGQLSRPAADAGQEPVDDFLAGQQRKPQRAVNENWGRELLELFSLGAGNYTEIDVREASRAFTGWTFEPKFRGCPTDASPGSSSIVPRTTTTARRSSSAIMAVSTARTSSTSSCSSRLGTFIARHLYNFFVADEPQVPGWKIEPPRDPRPCTLAKTFRESNYDIRAVLRVLFTADFFKNARFTTLRARPRWWSVRCVWSGGQRYRGRDMESCRCSLPTWARICSIHRAWKGGIPARSGSTAAR